MEDIGACAGVSPAPAAVRICEIIWMRCTLRPHTLSLLGDELLKDGIVAATTLEKVPQIMRGRGMTCNVTVAVLNLPFDNISYPLFFLPRRTVASVPVIDRCVESNVGWNTTGRVSFRGTMSSSGTSSCQTSCPPHVTVVPASSCSSWSRIHGTLPFGASREPELNHSYGNLLEKCA